MCTLVKHIQIAMQYSKKRQPTVLDTCQCSKQQFCACSDLTWVLCVHARANSVSAYFGISIVGSLWNKISNMVSKYLIAYLSPWLERVVVDGSQSQAISNNLKQSQAGPHKRVVVDGSGAAAAGNNFCRATVI